jgi:DNA-binding GntR family transcriptional regulator
MLRTKLRTDVADLIARDIQSGLLAPGMWLKQVDLEIRYGRPRLDIRRALDRLAQSRLVEHIPNRGYHVFPRDGRQTAEIRDIRAVLETAAVDGIMRNVTTAAIEELDRLARRFARLTRTGTVIEQYEANIAFHVALLSLSPNRELVQLVMDLRRRSSAAPASQGKTSGRVEQSSREHFEIVAALAAGDVEQLKRVVALHILQPEAEAARLASQESRPVTVSEPRAKPRIRARPPSKVDSTS